MATSCSRSNYRFRPVRAALAGEPIVLIEDGRVLERTLRRERLTVEELQEQARQSQITSLREVQWAVLETSGQISFIENQKQ